MGPAARCAAHEPALGLPDGRTTSHYRALADSVRIAVRSGARARRAWSADTHTEARKQLLRLADQLEHDHPGAAGSLREGLDETLTLLKLGEKGALERTLASTNPIENMIGTVKRVSRNVKRWRGGRWLCAGPRRG